MLSAAEPDLARAVSLLSSSDQHCVCELLELLTAETVTVSQEEHALPVIARLRHPNPKYPLLHLTISAPRGLLWYL